MTAEKGCRNIVFRNYVPRDQDLRAFCIPRCSVEALEKKIDADAQETIRSASKEDILSLITPKKPNWDLKRDVKKKLFILSKQTDKAIIQLIRQKVSENDVVKDFRQSSATNADDPEKQLSKDQREIAQSVVNAMNVIEQVDQDNASSDEEDQSCG